MTTSDFETVELSVSGCPICGNSLENVESGQNCAGCGSRARLRSMVPLVSDYLGTAFPALRSADQQLLAFAMTGAERKILSQLFKNFKSASLFGNYSQDHESGVDMRDLSRYAPDSFSGVFGCLLFDYFPEHECALQECFRVIAPGGVFFTHIAPYRLVDGHASPAKKGIIKSRSGYFEYLPGKTELADVEVGRDWFVMAMRRAGFQPSLVKVTDTITGVVSEWFVGAKPSGGLSNHSASLGEKNSTPSSWADTETVELSVSSCPACGNSLKTVESGQNCVGCGSRARTRSLAPLVNEYLRSVLPALGTIDLKLLAFAMTSAERNILAQLFKNFKPVSLYGNYSFDCEVGVDVRDMSRYAPDSFSGVFGCGLFDYFLEHERALQECFRVIAPGGVFFTHILSPRLVDGDLPPVQTGSVKGRPGYFEYLPENTELPSTKVGRNWFIAAMKRVGFKSLIVKVTDTVPGIISEWFVGIKPGVLSSDCQVSLDKNSRRATLTSEISTAFQSVVPIGEKGMAELKFELVKLPNSSLRFIEDHSTLAPDGGGDTREIVATDGSWMRLYVSRDLGESWFQIYEDAQWDSKIRAGLSLMGGGRLIRTFTGRMYHFDERGKLVSSSLTGAWHWHGSQGIGESATGTVMYAEYAPLRVEDGVQPLSVWRYRPNNPDQEWQRVLTLPAAVQPPQGEMRHFHVCRPNPMNPGQWVLASGDIAAHCRLWFSEDDGDTWSEVQLPSPVFPDLPENRHPRALRFTQFSALENGDLVWGTDDTTHTGCAVLIRMSMSSGSPVFELIGWLGKNCVRNIASYKNKIFLFLSESKHDSSSADCILYDASTKRITSLLLPNLIQQKHPVTDSLGSEKLVNGVGFFPALGVVLMDPSKRGIFRVSIKELEQ